MALFIAIEGIDGAGKTTQAELLCARLEAAGVTPVVVVHDPSGTALGEYVDRLKHDPEVQVSPEAELLLFSASRAQLVDEIIEPALKSGAMVVADRFAASTLAYQGYGRGLSPEHVRAMQEVATRGTLPGLTLLLDLPVSLGRQRKQKPAAPGADQLSLFDSSVYDRFEDAEADFLQRVREGYLRLAAEAEAAAPGSWKLINAEGPRERVADDIWKAVWSTLERGNKP